MRVKALWQSDIVRYGINGLFATAVNYGVLSALVALFAEGWVWLASGLASSVGITVSFLGSRWFVFPNGKDRAAVQFGKFVAVYAAAALLHAGVLFLWTDTMGWDWRWGFVLATGLQVAISYSANKWIVFQ